MESLDFWRLCDELTIYQAANLIVGMIPGEVEAMADVGTELTPSSHTRYVTSLNAATSALRTAIVSNRLPTCYCPSIGSSPDEFDWNEVTISVSALREWLASRGIRSGFFFEGQTETPDYLDPNNPRYAPKLAAAVRAWEAVIDPGGKSAKQALVKWLRENAAEFHLTDDEGKLNETGIEEVAKVANWQMTGGAPRTPGE